MNDKTNSRLVRGITKTSLYFVVVASVYVIIKAFVSNSYITVTVNWEMCYLGLLTLIIAIRIYSWIFLRRPVRKENERNVKR